MASRSFSRRQFLIGAGAAAGGWWVLPALAQAQEKTDPNRFILMADTHVCQDPDKVERDCNPYITFTQAVGEIVALTPRPAGLFIAGDCVYLEGRPGDYAMLKNRLQPVREAGIPVVLALGNHDRRANFRAVFPDAKPAAQPKEMDRQVSIVHSPHADWYLLDSLYETQSTPGRLGEAQLAWLAAELDKRPDTPALLMAHHYPASLGDNGLEDSEAFMNVIDARPQAKAYFFGHSHAWRLKQQENGLHLINLPANAWLFDEALPRGWVNAQLRKDGVTLTLNCLKHDDPRHGSEKNLTWRA